MLGVGAKKKTYLDDVFSTQVYTGTSATNAVNNGINLSSEGGLVWTKARNQAWSNLLIDTVRGGDKVLFSELGNTQDTRNDLITSFNNNGYTAGADVHYGSLNNSSANVASWSFRRSPGFCDVVSWTGNGTARTIAHSLESIPGLILIKCTDAAFNWRVYHRGVTSGVNPADYGFCLNTTASPVDNSTYWNDTLPTSTHFTIGTNATVNSNGSNYIAYVFAGGESTASTARSVQFDGSSSEVHLSMSANTDLDMGTGDFTIEFWYKDHDSSYRQSIIASNRTWQSGFTQIQVSHPSHQNHIVLWDYDIDSNNPVIKSTKAYPPNGTWRHVAISRSGSTLRMFVNGNLEKSATQTGSLDFSDSHGTLIGYNPSDIGLTGHISNLRVVKGTAVYTSSFRPPTEPLTNITNTKLLCCNNSHVAGKTVGPSLTVTGSPTARTYSPFDDPAGFVFGDSEEGIVKCGSYKGNGADDGAEINLGWEPQWLLIKEIDASNRPWVLVDSIRGITNGGNDPLLSPSSSAAGSGPNFINLTSTGFKFVTAHGDYNGSSNYIYMAIRRPDGYVGKPIKVGTDAFAMDTGDGNPSALPSMDSNFPVDFGTIKLFASSQGWYTGSRLTGDKVLFTDTNSAESSNSILEWDSNKGFWKNLQSTYQGWMWKRHAGFDVVTYPGNSTSGHTVPHSLNAVPEMMWVKNRGKTESWYVFHKDNGSNPENKALNLNTDGTSQTGTWLWNDTLPTSTHFTLGNDNSTNGNGYEMLALLFSSVAGVSKVGSYTGSDSAQTITLGFQPRFIIVKNVTNSNDWIVIDSLRGIASSDGNNSKKLQLNTDAAQDNTDIVYSSGQNFTVNGNNPRVNDNGSSYIYYAHA